MQKGCPGLSPKHPSSRKTPPRTMKPARNAYRTGDFAAAAYARSCSATTSMPSPD